MDDGFGGDFRHSFHASADRSNPLAPPPQDGLARCASAPIGLQSFGAGNDKFGCKALVLSTPPRLERRRKGGQAHLRPLASPASPSGVSANGGLSPLGSPASPTKAGQARPATTGHGSCPPNSLGSASPSSKQAQAVAPKLRTPKPQSPSEFTHGGISDGGSDSDGMSAMRGELVRLRKQQHRQACEFTDVKNELVQTQRELLQARAEADELRLKLSNLERIDRTKSSELLIERRKNDEMSKQVKEMSANLLSLTGNFEGGNQEGSGLRKRCFKLVQQNTALSVQARLLQRQKGWAEAKARVLQNEVTRVYLGVHDRVKDEVELEGAMTREFDHPQFPTDEAQIYQLVMPSESVHQDTIIDFITHITHTNGQDIHGFLQSSKVFSDGIKNDCLSGLAKEFYAVWSRANTLPAILRAVERVVHLSDYLTAFECFASEIMELLGCKHAKIWVVDRFRGIMRSCVRDGDGQKTFTLDLPSAKKGKNVDLTGMGVAAAAYMTQKPVIVADARDDPRFRPAEEAGPDGHAKSIICVPVARMMKAGRSPQVRVVLQAVNKLKEPNFDPDRDERILRLLGTVSMEVLQVCETSSASNQNQLRTQKLLHLFNDYTPCDTPQNLLDALQRGLADTFQAQAAALHLVTGNGTVHVSMDKHNQKKLNVVPCDSLRGFVGNVAKTMNPNTTLASQIEGSRYDSSVDLPPTEKTVIHTIPIGQNPCHAVCQFSCLERERGAMTDDGAYHPENTSHFKILKLLLTFVQKHLHVVTPKPPGEEGDHGSKGSKSSTTAPPSDSAPDGERGNKSVRFKVKRSNSITEGESFSDAEMEAAALKIQSMHRGRMARKKVEKKRASVKEPQPKQLAQPKADGRSSGRRRTSNVGQLGLSSSKGAGLTQKSPRRASNT